MKGSRRYLTALRRGVGLGLALVAAWGISLTVDFSALGDRVTALGQSSSLAVSILSGQLGQLPGEEQGLTGGPDGGRRGPRGAGPGGWG